MNGILTTSFARRGLGGGRPILRRLLPGLLAGWLCACSVSAPSTRLPAQQLSPGQKREATRAYDRLIALEAAGPPSRTLDAAYDLLDRYPGFSHEDQILMIAARAAGDLGQDARARSLLQRLVQDHPESAARPEALWRLASMQSASRRWLEAAESYIAYLAQPDDPGREKKARQQLAEIIDTRLDLDELGRLEKTAEGTVAASYVFFRRAERSYRSGNSPQRSGKLLEDFLDRYPDSRYREEAEQMLAELATRGEYQPRSNLDLAHVDRVGLLCPLTGEYAALGQAMYDGALMALEEHNRLTGDAMKLVALDTEGDGVQAVLSARSLIEDEGVLAILGSLLSSTTIAAAAVCQERRVPLVSPTATQENISSIGSEIFQTNLTAEFETRLVAWAVVDLLRRTKLAVLYPDTRAGRHAAEIFTREVEARGARVVAAEPFDRGITDFKEPIERLRIRAPEALFVPAGPSSMRLIAPQLTFYHLDVQLLGPSTWNNPRLAQDMAESLDRAVFPSETALMPQAERERFTRLWIRRHGGEQADPFALKTYFATRRILRAIHDGARTRRSLQEALARRFLAGDESGTVEAPAGALRVLEGGEVKDFPPEIVAAASVVSQPAPVDSLETPESRREPEAQSDRGGPAAADSLGAGGIPR